MSYTSLLVFANSSLLSMFLKRRYTIQIAILFGKAWSHGSTAERDWMKILYSQLPVTLCGFSGSISSIFSPFHSYQGMSQYSDLSYEKRIISQLRVSYNFHQFSIICGARYHPPPPLTQTTSSKKTFLRS